MGLSEILSLLLGLGSIILALYFGTRKRRLSRKIQAHEENLTKLKCYSSTTGYKVMIHDCFISLSYVGASLLLFFGIKHLLINFNVVSNVNKVFAGLESGILIGSGLVLAELFILLARANSSKESMKSLKIKIDKLKEKKNEI